MPGEGDVTALPLFRWGEDSSLQEESVRFCYYRGVPKFPHKKIVFAREHPHKVVEEKGKESNGDMANLARIENGV
jgi:hypothetical protein